MNPSRGHLPARGAARVLFLALCLAHVTAPAQRPEVADRPTRAASAVPATITALSRSGQFVVSGPSSPAGVPLQSRSGNEPMRDLSPTTLAVSCERVKTAVLQALDLPDVWRNSGGGRTGKIQVQIDAHRRDTAPLAVEAAPFEEGWNYLVPLPPRAPEDRVVRVLTHALLMELANRGGNQRAADPPLWLVEGITQTLLSGAPQGLLLQPQTRRVTDVRMGDPLAGARAQLARRPALPFHELSQPDLSQLDPSSWDHYAACAHLAFHELSRLPDGRRRLAQWLVQLQRHWNWQTGFLEHFQPEFQSLLDVEKWWALSVAQFTGRDVSQAWPVEVTLRKLQDILTPVGILPGAGNQAARLPLEQVILEWDFSRQIPVLRQALRQLQAVRLFAHPDIVSLVYRYGDVLEEYLGIRQRAGYAPAARGQVAPSVRLLVRETVGRLRSLDAERAAALNSPPAPAPPVNPNPDDGPS